MSDAYQSMRVYHRYLGFFLSGIMAIYAFSGVVMIFRSTDYLKVDKTRTVSVPPDTKPDELGRALRIREFKIDKQENGVIYFRQGSFDPATGIATVTTKELPTILERLTDLHKASTNSPLFFLNIFFGLGLLFFVVSAFFMFLPGTPTLRKGIYFAMGGATVVIVMLMVR